MLGSDNTLGVCRVLGCGLRLRKLREPLEKPPTRSSASNENIRRWRVHFLPDLLPSLFSLSLFLLLQARIKKAIISPSPTKATGTAMAALSAGEQEMPWHSIGRLSAAAAVADWLSPGLAEVTKVVAGEA